MMRIPDLRRDDGALLTNLHATMSPNSRYQTFYGEVPTLNPSMLRVLLGVDGQGHVALVEYQGLKRFLDLSAAPSHEDQVR